MDEQYINEETLRNFDITIADADKDSLLKHLNDELQERVGAEITAMLDDAKLEELVSLQETGSDEQVGEWLAQNVPELSAIVQDEIDILLGDLAEKSDSINNVSA